MYLYHPGFGDVLPIGTFFENGRFLVLMRGEDAGEDEDVVLVPLSEFRVLEGSEGFLVKHPDYGELLLLREDEASVTVANGPEMVDGELLVETCPVETVLERSRWEFWHRTGRSVFDGSTVTLPITSEY